MKKQKLIIYCFSCLLLVFMQQATASPNKSFIKAANKSQYAPVFSTRSHLGLDIYTCKCLIWVYSQRNNDGHWGSFVATLSSFFYPGIKKDCTGENEFSFMKHLLHIYPSHSFW